MTTRKPAKRTEDFLRLYQVISSYSVPCILGAILAALSLGDE